MSLADYKGKVMLIVNTATGCGFTPQYSELQALYELHHDDGLEILDFPCNQFGAQAPGSDEEIHDFCTGRFGITLGSKRAAISPLRSMRNLVKFHLMLPFFL